MKVPLLYYKSGESSLYLLFKSSRTNRLEFEHGGRSEEADHGPKGDKEKEFWTLNNLFKDSLKFKNNQSVRSQSRAQLIQTELIHLFIHTNGKIYNLFVIYY